MKKLGVAFILLLLFTATTAQDLKTYQIYDKEGDSVSFGEMIKTLAAYDVVLFGEYHNNSILHWLELKTAEALYDAVGSRLLLGAEMFERDNQEAVNRYLSGASDAETFSKEARLWPNFYTDYKPILDFAKANHIQFIATNIPRRYASLVAKKGMDSLKNMPKAERKYMAKMPIMVDTATPGYSEMADMLESHAGDKVMDFIAAQAVKDATMAASIRKKSNKKHLFLHFNGDYHSRAYGGIYWYLKKKKKRWKIAVISMAEAGQKNLPLPEEFVPTEFNIVLPEDMTKTY